MPERLISLIEFETKRLPKSDFSDELANVLWPQYEKKIAIEWPSPRTAWNWELRSEGWVGYIPLTPDIVLQLAPKVPIANLFRMLEYAYRLKGLHFLPGQIQSQTLQEFYEVLAKILSLRVSDRARIGLYRTYVGESERTYSVRGRVEIAESLRRAWRPDLQCCFEEHTADVDENQILFWTLSQILQSGVCTERVLPSIRRAFRALQGLVTLKPVDAGACVSRVYNRLSHDYAPMHALCRFFLEQTGPGHIWGDRRMLPFLIDMSQLYELFVAEWLNEHLPSTLRVRPQERVEVGVGENLHFKIDLVLYDAESDTALAVLDTKYKKTSVPASGDLEQVVAYAVSKGSQEAILIYPAATSTAVRPVGSIRVRSMSFLLDSDLEEAGGRFLSGLASIWPQHFAHSHSATPP